MKKIVEWIKKSNRYKHFIGGGFIGFGANSCYCAAYSVIGVAAALEYKDKAYGGKWDWIDFGLTIAGAGVGHLIRISL